MLYILIQLTGALLSPVQLLSPFTYGKPSQTKCLTACCADGAEAPNAEQSGEHLSVFMYYNTVKTCICVGVSHVHVFDS